jgi:hypothetical protein
LTLAKQTGVDHDKRKGITVYFMSSKPVQVSLMAKALNAEGDEIGRSVVDVEFTADDARYVAFAFDAEMDSQLVEKYVVEAKQPTAAEASPAEDAAGTDPDDRG